MPGAQAVVLQYLQNAQTSTGVGTLVESEGFDGVLNVEIVETLGGTATVSLQGSFDGGTNWYSVGYQQIDATASLTRAVSAISVSASSAHVYQILDPYPKVRANVTANSSASVSVRVYGVQM